MYAIIEDGKRQLKVEEGQELDVDYRKDASVGDELKFDRVVAYRNDEGLKLGQPLVASASVTVRVVAVTQGPKLVVQKYRRRKNYRRRTGHRQVHTRVVVDKIEIG